MTAKTTVTIEAVYPDGTDLTNRRVVVQLIHGGAGGTVDGELIAERTTVPLSGAGPWSIALYPTAAISPSGCFYRFTIDNSSPTINRDISVPSSGPVSWTDAAILLENPEPPVTIPAAVSGDPLDVLRVKSDGTGYELAASGAGTTVDVVSNVATGTLLGRTTSGTGDSEELAPLAVRALLDIEVGTDVQAYDADLAAVAALTPSNDDIIQRKSGAWTNRTMAQLKADLPGWQTISRKTIATASASESFTITGYKMIRCTIAARSTRNASVNDTLRMRFNGDTGSNYSTQAAALTTYANPVNVPNSVTTTDRIGHAIIQWAYSAGHRLSGTSVQTSPVSSTGLIDAGQAWAFMWTGAASAAPTTVEFYCGNGNIAAGSEFLVEGYV